MKWQRVLFWALFLLLAALALDALIGREVASDASVKLWEKRLRDGGALLLGIACLLWLLEKAGLRVSGARCRTCKKSIPHGQTFCRDHLREFIEKGRERLHQQRGTGV